MQKTLDVLPISLRVSSDGYDLSLIATIKISFASGRFLAKIRVFAAIAVLPLIAACSGLKLDKDSNCLNQNAACFKEDTTRPKVSSFETQQLRDGSNSVTTLEYIDVQFSEELRDGEIASKYAFVANPAVHNFTVTSVQKISAYTYRLMVGGGLISSGSIELHIAPLTDYNGNPMNTSTPVSFMGSVNIGIQSSVNHNGVSNSGGYSSIDIQFYHTYTADITNDNSYTIRLTSGAADCATGTVLTSGSNLGPHVANTINLNVPVGSFSSGVNRLVVCINNLNNPNATNLASWPIIRDDVAPTLTYAPATGSYAQPKTITLTCGNNFDKIAYTSTDQQTTPPADPATPTFNPATGTITTGMQYSGSLIAANPANPTYTKFLWRCIDIAGNLSAAPAVMQFYIDSTIPDVVVNLGAGFRQYLSAVNTSTTLSFSTDQVSKTYNIRRNGTTCASGGDGTLLATGTTPALAGQLISEILDITTHFTTNNTTYPVRICVAGTGIQWGTAYLDITRDGTAPTIAASVVSGTYGAAQSVDFTCDDSFGVVDKVAYNRTEADGVVVPAIPSDPDFNTITGDVTNGTEIAGPYDPADRKTTRVAFRCIDRAGNRSATVLEQYVIDASLPIVTFVSTSRYAVSNNAGAYGNTTLTWSANRADLTYRIRRVADCNHAGTPANSIATGTVSAANVNQLNILPFGSFPVNGTIYPMRICVYNFAGLSSHQTADVNIRRDDTPPTIPTPAVAVANVDATNFTLTWAAADDTGGSGIAGYRIFRSLTSGVYNATPDYTATSGPATIAMPDTQKYFLKIVPFDAAGNVPVAAGSYTEATTKPSITLIVSGLGAGNSFNLTDGTSSLLISADSAGSPWTTAIASGGTYNFSISAAPSDQVCSIKELQFGILNTNRTITVRCVNGYMVAGRFQAVPPSAISYMLYRTSATVIASSYSAQNLTNPNSIVVTGGLAYFGDSLDCDPTATVAYCVYSMSVSGVGSVAAVVTGLTRPVRGIASDGSNLYFVTLDNDNKLYKYSIVSGSLIEIASGFRDPYGLAVTAGNAYICDWGFNQIVRVNLSTGVKTTIASGLPSGPYGITIVGANLYFSIDGRHAIYSVAASGGTPTVVYGNETTSGVIDAATTSARFNAPADLTYDGANNIFVADRNNSLIRRINLRLGTVTTLAGDTSAALYSNGTGPQAKIPYPVGIASDGRNLLISLQGTDKRIVRLADSGLVGYWPLNGHTLDLNSSLTINNAVQNTATVGTGRLNKSNGAHVFNDNIIGTTSGVTGLPTGNSNRTLCTWFKPASLPAIGGWTGIAGYGRNNANEAFYLGLRNDGGTQKITMIYNGGYSGYAEYELPLNTWSHICGRHASGQSQVYVNGHPLGPQVAHNLATINSDFSIGSWFFGAGGVVGSISDMRIYSRALNDGEINTLAQDALSTNVGQSFNAAATGLLSHYAFDGATTTDRGALAADSACTGGCPTGVAGKDADASGAYNFNGSNALVGNSSVGLPSGQHPRTFCAWVAPSIYPAAFNWNVIAGYGSTSTNRANSLGLYNNSGTIAVEYMGWSNNLSVAYQIPLNTWSHVCGTFDAAQNAVLYVDGRAIGSATKSGWDTSLATSVNIGRQISNAEHFPGRIDDVRIYNNALTADQIRQLAVQVPNGLLVRYDFTGDVKDVSGFGNDASVSSEPLGSQASAQPILDRFGNSAAAYRFDGTDDRLTLTSDYLPFNNSARTMCAWISTIGEPATNGQFAVMHHGNNTAGGGHTLAYRDASGIKNITSGYWATDAELNPYTLYKGSAWNHICGVNGPSENKLYLNGAVISSVGANTLSMTYNKFSVGALTSGLYSFSGDIDDVRVYNRALSQVEVQALVQQRNKIVKITASTHTGDIINVGGGPHATSIVAADSMCSSQFGAGYKALIVDGINRRACTTSNCATADTNLPPRISIKQNIDWVLQPNVTYLQDGGSTPIYTANGEGVWNFANIVYSNGISASPLVTWTGLNADWIGDSNNCSGWTSMIGGLNGMRGLSQAVTLSQLVQWSTFSCSAANLPIYCVEQ